MAEALDNVQKLSICAGPKALKVCLETVHIDSEPDRCCLSSTTCYILPCKKKKFMKDPQWITQTCMF